MLELQLSKFLFQVHKFCSPNNKSRVVFYPPSPQCQQTTCRPYKTPVCDFSGTVNWIVTKTQKEQYNKTNNFRFRFTSHTLLSWDPLKKTSSSIWYQNKRISTLNDSMQKGKKISREKCLRKGAQRKKWNPIESRDFTDRPPLSICKYFTIEIASTDRLLTSFRRWNR